MEADRHLTNNVDRFSGFQDTYNRYRPKAPQLVVDILAGYLGQRPKRVVDVGCGTGLSSFIWATHTDEVVGFEPSDDMRGVAEAARSAHPKAHHISFLKAYSYQLQMEDESADIVTCSQSFHWMEPESTLREVARVLRPGGVFAAYDCDWPPTVDWRVEAAYEKLMDKVEALVAARQPKEQQVTKWPKHEHLQNIAASGHFCFAKEIVFHNTEPCDAERYVGLAVSQGGLQTVIKSGWTDLDTDIASFRAIVDQAFAGRTRDILFSYRMRVGIR
ncbi:class I SAM-dependent methyltransferase [Alicyclobacillus sp. ALC3]|uniref:class I SAM-dependent methyltransferase n=1 Tax=Alicyclobacillus sp. ALC3 TaxID=2796143 RepID=UPI00237836D0|nr:class I SAM-dependent methyltransferase [Alicyclobacillus sp. ALC3]